MAHRSPAGFPYSYDECRQRFRWAAHRAGAHQISYELGAATGPDNGALAIDVARIGAPRPKRALLIMSGTHGIEGFAGSMMQSDLLAADPFVAGDSAVLVVHGVNPWGMAWWRRANENNVDLNRNWGVGLSDQAPAGRPVNDAYGELHDLLCPGDRSALDSDQFLAELAALVAQRGVAWVRTAISSGQYTHADGLYFGGTAEQPSTGLLRRIAEDHLADVGELLVVDLHTGHGRHGTRTILSRAPLGSDDDRWIRSVFGDESVETTVGNPDATTSVKSGQLAPGIIEHLGPDLGRSVTLEIGTERETRMIAAERAEHWVHMTDRRATDDGRAAVWEHRICSIPDDAEWERKALDHGRTVLGQALAAAVG